MKAFTRKTKQPNTTITQLKELWHDWGLNKCFRKAMLYGTLSGQARVPLSCVTKLESRWLIHHGYELQIKNEVGYIEL